jgi:hypothetical protein
MAYMPKFLLKNELIKQKEEEPTQNEIGSTTGRVIVSSPVEYFRDNWVENVQKTPN